MSGVTLDSVYDLLQQTLILANQILAQSGQISTKQMNVTVLSDLSANLGTVLAGEFRSGQGIPSNPSAPFTGVRFGYPPFSYAGGKYAIAGVLNDVLQFGMSNTDGRIYAGAGDVLLDASGVSLLNGSTNGHIKWYDTSSNTWSGFLIADPGIMWVSCYRKPGASWASSSVIIHAYDTISVPTIDARLYVDTLDGGRVLTNVPFYPVQASVAPPYHEGAMYYDTTLHKLRVGGAVGWETITSI